MHRRQLYPPLPKRGRGQRRYKRNRAGRVQHAQQLQNAAFERELQRVAKQYGITVQEAFIAFVRLT